MAKGHTAVIRRSLNLPEWIRVRLAEISHWKELASCPLDGWEIRQAEYNGPGDYRFMGRWRPIRHGELWGGPDGTFFLRSQFAIPPAFKGLRVWFELLTPTEMLFRIGGSLVNAIDPNRSEVPLLRRARGGEVFAVELEAYMRSAPDDGRTGQRIGEGHGCVQTWRDPRLVSHDPVFQEFMYDYQVAWDVAACPTVESEVCNYIYHHLDAALKLIDRETRDRRAFHHSLEAAREYLRKNVYEAPGMSGPGTLALVGHAHVDVAYHWRVRQGIRKNARTTVVQLALMEEYPEFLYCHTQPFVYEMIQKHYPELHRRVKAKVRSGRWELVGTLYVEPDCNVPSGESLIRQCLLGKLYFLREFGVDVDTCWLPDVFGNSWIMPQILLRSGIRYFVSNKMSTWNDTNQFPHTNFLWKGVDGSIVNACVPASHFISWLAPDQLIANWEGFKEKLTVGESMNMYGFGDGGGGATREMLETARRIRNFPGLPRTRLTSAKGYLDSAFSRPEKLAVWDDELYLEMHRGTTTTKAVLKKLNRRCELAAREAEIFATLAEQFGPPVPKEELTEAWKAVLVNQFHDILPGSHTTPVAQEAEESYRRALGTFESIRAAAQDAIARSAVTDSLPGTPYVVFNSLNWRRTGLVRIPLDRPGALRIIDGDGQPVPSQIVEERDGRRFLLFTARDVPSVGYRTYYVSRAARSAVSPACLPKASAQSLENRFFRIELNRRGEISRLFDKRSRREVIADGQTANVFQLFEDKPGVYDAWDIVINYKDKSWDISGLKRIAAVEEGPVRAGIRIEKEFFNSRLVQTIRAYADIPRIDFETWIDWHEHNKLLKVSFPVAVLSRRATYDLSYGSIQRPTHGNTSWDRAKFEVCGHQWADLSETDYGVSLLNDCKYGWDIEGNRMRLSLLRGPVRPDPDSDQGEHELTYSLFPHAGGWQEAGTVQEAYSLNSPLSVVRAKRHGGSLSDRHSFLAVEPADVLVGALKPAEEGSGYILRLAEVLGGRKQVAVRLDRGMSQVQECDLLERAERNVPTNAKEFRTWIRPFELKTFRVRVQPTHA